MTAGVVERKNRVKTNRNGGGGWGGVAKKGKEKQPKRQIDVVRKSLSQSPSAEPRYVVGACKAWLVWLQAVVNQSVSPHYCK